MNANLPPETPHSRADFVNPSKLIKDRRTQELVTALDDIIAGAQSGVRNERYVQAARGVLLDNNWERRTRNFGLLLESLRPEDTVAIQELFAAMGKEGRPFEEYRYFGTRWGEVDGRGAMEYFKTHPELRLSPWDMRQVIKGWGQSAPQEALAWLAENKDFAQRYPQATNGVLQGWSRSDPDAAASWLLTNSTNPALTASSLSEIMLEQLYGKGLKGSGDWLVSLPDSADVNAAKHAAWVSIQNRLYSLGTDDAAALWGTMSNQSWIGWSDFEAFSRNASAASGGDDAAFLGAVLNKTSPDQIGAQFERWATEAPELASGWLTRHADNTPFRTAAIQGMVRYLEKSDPEAANVWRQQLPK
jgi:hypothetical protein